jgi:hypothetical protein
MCVCVSGRAVAVVVGQEEEEQEEEQEQEAEEEEEEAEERSCIGEYAETTASTTADQRGTINGRLSTGPAVQQFVSSYR